MKVKSQAAILRFFVVANLLFVTTPVSMADEVSKDFWMDAMKSELPKTFCQSMEFFRECFDVSEDQCIEAASLATKICMHQYINQIPDTLVQPKDGAKWSNIIGQCAGENYHQTLNRMFKNTKECNEIDYWK